MLKGMQGFLGRMRGLSRAGRAERDGWGLWGADRHLGQRRDQAGYKSTCLFLTLWLNLDQREEKELGGDWDVMITGTHRQTPSKRMIRQMHGIFWSVWSSTILIHGVRFGLLPADICERAYDGDPVSQFLLVLMVVLFKESISDLLPHLLSQRN